MSQQFNTMIAMIGIDIGKNSFHVVGHDEHGAIVLRQKWSRSQGEARFANMPPCLIGMEVVTVQDRYELDCCDDARGSAQRCVGRRGPIAVLLCRNSWRLMRSVAL